MDSFAAEIPCFEDITCVPFSAVTGEGVAQLREIIEEAAEEDRLFYERQEGDLADIPLRSADSDDGNFPDGEDGFFGVSLTPNRK